MKAVFIRTAVWPVVWSAVCVVLLWSSYSQAAAIKVRGERAGHWDVSFMLNYIDGDTLDVDGLDDAKVDSDLGWGLGFHYNFNAHWNLGFDMAFNRPDYEVRFDAAEPGEPSDPVHLDHTSSRFDGQFNGQYNILTGNVTPYIQAGLGWTYTDSNIVESLSYYCGGYYYPYCRTYANTYDETAFSYNLGVGVRWDVSDAVFIKFAYIQQWVDSDGAPSPKTGRAEVGVMF